MVSSFSLSLQILYTPCPPVITPKCKPKHFWIMVPEVFYGSNLRSKQHLLPQCWVRSFTLRLRYHMRNGYHSHLAVVPSQLGPAMKGSSLVWPYTPLPVDCRLGRSRSLPPTYQSAQRRNGYETALDQRRLDHPVDPPAQRIGVGGTQGGRESAGLRALAQV